MTIISTGGKQYSIKPNETVTVEKLPLNVGQTVSLVDVLTDQPVELEVVNQIRGPKIMIRKFRNKTRYNKFGGHRQLYTILRLKEAESAKPKPTRTRRKAALTPPKGAE